MHGGCICSYINYKMLATSAAMGECSDIAICVCYKYIANTVHVRQLTYVVVGYLLLSNIHSQE